VFPTQLRRHIVMLLCVKAAALSLIYVAFIAPAAQPKLDSRSMAGHILYGSGN
jgi:hypothetical protein